MIDIKFLREHPEIVKEAAKNKGVDVDIDHVLEIDTKYRELLQLVQKLQEDRNKWSSLKSPNLPHSLKKGEETIREGIRKLKGELKKQEDLLRAVEGELKDWLYKIPNLPKDVKVGINESENTVVRNWGTQKTFDFKVRDHVELGELLDIIDIKRAAKTSGTRFNYLKNEAVLLEFALVQLALEKLIVKGFTPIIPPVLIKKEMMRGLGYMEHGSGEDIFSIEKDGLLLAGTAEHTIVAMHAGEVFDKKDLPRRYIGFSSAFRREAGSYGKDTKGILRVHQFDKVEMVSFVAAEDDDEEHEYLLGMQEKLFQMLEIPYQVVKMCTGDLGFPAARKYDIEAWVPSQGKYREVTSVSTVTDFQSRRLNIKYQDGDEKKYVHILNGTAFAIGRTLIAILENYQNEDGSVTIPEALRKYVKFDKIAPKK